MPVFIISADVCLPSLDDYLRIQGFSLKPINSHINEGYMSKEQEQIFKQELSQYTKEIRFILEIGLNGGHSAEMFCQAKPDADFYSVDLGHHSYTPVAVDFMTKKYGKRFTYIKGDSTKILPKLIRDKILPKFDLIYIDGGHSFKVIKSDLNSCFHLAHKETIVWIDDYRFDVLNAVNKMVDRGKLKVIKVLSCGKKHPKRWAVAKFIK